MQKEWIIYEDDVIIAINKPGGLPTQGTPKSTQSNLYFNLQHFLDERAQKKTYLALHHRLDSATSGIIIFCKDRRYNQAIATLFKDNLIDKTYLAISEVLNHSSPDDRWIINQPLITYPYKHYKKSKISQKGKASLTSFKLLKKLNQYALIECHPQTGRLHQIRVHLSSCNLPIVGDFHYNPKRTNFPLMLHAYKLKFIHPVSKIDIELTAPIPNSFFINPD